MTESEMSERMKRSTFALGSSPLGILRKVGGQTHFFQNFFNVSHSTFGSSFLPHLAIVLTLFRQYRRSLPHSFYFAFVAPSDTMVREKRSITVFGFVSHVSPFNWFTAY